MKRVLAITTSLMMGASTLVAPALADDGVGLGTSADAQLGADAETGTAVDPGTTASTGAEANLGTVVSAINAGDAGASDIQAAADASSVTIVRIDDLAQGESATALDNAIAMNQDAVDELHSAIEANAAVSAKLQEEQLAADDVVAADAGADGSLTVYVR